MAIMTITRESRCGDCKHLGYTYKGKRKFLWCTKHERYAGRKDSARQCIDSGDFLWIYSNSPTT